MRKQHTVSTIHDGSKAPLNEMHAIGVRISEYQQQIRELESGELTPSADSYKDILLLFLKFRIEELEWVNSLKSRRSDAPNQ